MPLFASAHTAIPPSDTQYGDEMRQNQNRFTKYQVKPPPPIKKLKDLSGVKEGARAKGDEGKQAKKYASDAKEVLKKLAEEHKGTPYEVLAKRDASNALGLEWRPTRK